jgi:murein DD-endopeptidase MepM/ murein hydrolase activator NlpD
VAEPARYLPATAAAAPALGDDLRSPAEPTAGDAPEELAVTLTRGDTLSSVLDDAGIDRPEAHEAIAALRKFLDLRTLQIGQKLVLTLLPNPESASLIGLEVEASFDRFAGVTRYPDGSFRGYEQQKQWDKLAFRVKGRVSSGVFSDGVDNGAPPWVMAEFLKLFSFDVDFERDLHSGDRFELVFERYQDSNGTLIDAGNLLFAALTVNGENREYYRFLDANGAARFYDAKGNSIHRALLRTPVDGARLTSGFGKRRHPILGYTKMHKGLDFAAPSGTPIRAAGDGELIFVGRQRGYGNVIEVRHDGSYETLYAHMRRFAKGIKVGGRVKQGQVIGYVGNTGRSTGPHLHYEVRYQGTAVDPSGLRLPSGDHLEAAQLKAFQDQIATIEVFREDEGSAIASANGVKF